MFIWFPLLSLKLSLDINYIMDRRLPNLDFIALIFNFITFRESRILAAVTKTTVIAVLRVVDSFIHTSASRVASTVDNSLQHITALPLCVASRLDTRPLRLLRAFSCFVCVQYAISRRVRPTTFLSLSAYYDHTKPVFCCFVYEYIYIIVFAHRPSIKFSTEFTGLTSLVVGSQYEISQQENISNMRCCRWFIMCSCRAMLCFVVFISFGLSVWECSLRERVDEATHVCGLALCLCGCSCGGARRGDGRWSGRRRQFSSERHRAAAFSPRRARSRDPTNFVHWKLFKAI